MKRYICFILFACLLGYSAVGQTLTVNAPNVVSMDETFRVVFTANGNISDFQWEPTGDFEIVWGPQTGRMSNTTIVNGKRESSHTETYTYLLQPVREGRFTIPGATAMVSKNKCNSGSFTIEVVKAQESQNASSGAATGAADSRSNNAAATGTVAKDDLFLKLTVSKTSVVKGEPISATLKLYTRTDIAGFEDVKFPTFNGFWNKETFTPQNIEFSRENVNGTIYNSAVIRRYMLLPMQEGSIIIDPAEMVCLVRIRTSSGGRSIFDDFFDSYQTIRKRISSAAIKINVASLPAGAPESFYGGVGEFKVKVEASKDSIASNEAASLKITVSGNGNISMLETPKVDFPSDFEVYDVKTTENIDAGGTSGTKVFEVPFIPRGAGEYTIGPIPYSYYDIKAKKYITVNSEPIKLKVSASSAALDASGPTSAIRQQVRNVGEDIRYIATGKSALKEKDSFFLFSPLFFALTALIIILFFVAVKTSEKLSARRSDIAGTRNRKANKMARERLRQASQYLKGNLSMAYYEELHKAVLGYLSDKLTISSANLSRDNIVESLQQRGVSEDLINSVAGIIDECEAARYSPDATVEKMEELYDNAVATISALEGSIGKRTKKGGKALIFVAMMLSATISLKAADNEQVRNQWESANELYASGDFQQALEQYIAIEQSGLVSPQLYYNIGNAYYRLGNTARSVLYYERALKLDPSYSDAANNLAIVQRSVLDKIELLPEFILSTWVKKLKYSLSSNLWSIIFLLLFALAAFMLFIFKRGDSLAIRKSAFIAACVALLFSIMALLFAISERSDALSNDKAVVMTAVSSVKSSPEGAATSLFILHEGTKVEIIDELGSWKRVQLSDGRQGWLPASDIEEI